MQLIPSSDSNTVSLYFHIPFCNKKCHYCHFFVLPNHEPLKSDLMKGLYLELQSVLPELHDKKIASIYFGGGTPYLLGAKRIGEILNWVSSKLSFEKDKIEITLEANPEDIDFEGMQAYRQEGINRISIGLQTLDDQLLNSLGRLHSSNKGIAAVEMTQAAGIDNISVDLMYDLPGQTVSSWYKTLEAVRLLPITHLSLYNLTIEPHTQFFKNKDRLSKIIPDEQASLSMYEAAVATCEEMGLQQYEISAFAKEGRFSQHNVGYWTARPFLGLGPSAFSYWHKKRYRNVANLSKYLKSLAEGISPVDFSEALDLYAHRRELLAVEMRLRQGVDLNNFQQRHGSLGAQTVQTLQELIREGFLDDNHGTRIMLTKKGTLFYDSVAAEII